MKSERIANTIFTVAGAILAGIPLATYMGMSPLEGGSLCAGIFFLYSERI